MKYSKNRTINAVCGRLVRSGHVLTVPCSPSDYRAELNWLSQVRRDYGVSA